MRSGKNPLGLSGYTALFVSSAKPGLGHPGVIRAAYIGLMDLLARAQSYFSTCCYGQILPRHSLRFIAHGTLPIHRATPGAGFVQPSSRSPLSHESEITLSPAETYSTPGYVAKIIYKGCAAFFRFCESRGYVEAPTINSKPPCPPRPPCDDSFDLESALFEPALKK